MINRSDFVQVEKYVSGNCLYAIIFSCKLNSTKMLLQRELLLLRLVTYF